MSFFDDTPERMPPWSDGPGHPAWRRPNGVLPGLSPVGLILARTDEMALAVGNVLGYPNGFEFTVNARLRREQFVWGKSPLDPLASPRTGREPELALRLGVLYADGRRARTSSHRPIPVSAADGEGLVLREVGTGGTDRQWDGRLWVHPLPPGGTVTFIASWLLYDMTEARVELDSSVIREAAERAVVLWPDDPAAAQEASGGGV
jgi:hypothetical protein